MNDPAIPRGPAAAEEDQGGDIELTTTVGEEGDGAGEDDGGVTGVDDEPSAARAGTGGTATSARGAFFDLFTRRNKYLLILFGTAVIGMISTAVFLGLYINALTSPNANTSLAPKGGDAFPTPVILKVSSRSNYSDPNYVRMFISGYNDTFPEGKEPPGIMRWRNQDDFWYLEVLPLSDSLKDCPTRRTPFGEFDPVLQVNPFEITSCNLYDFRLVIFNDLDTGATIHFHGLNPPSNQDGVPFVANANINPQNMQRYRFNQFTYPGLHWMHAHTGFQQAFGVSAPIVLQHSDGYDKANGFSKEDDLVVMLEDGTRYPKCAYSEVWFDDECKNLTNEAGSIALLINRREEPLEHTPREGAKKVRLRLLNGGTLSNWRITTLFSKDNNGTTDTTMEILATDGHDVVPGVTTGDFALGLANRIDVVVDIDPDDDRDILITGVQMAPFMAIKNPALRHIVIRNRNTTPGQRIQIENLPPFWKDDTQKIQTNFGLIKNLTAAHPLPAEEKITKSFTIWNRGGNIDGGFPLEIFKGLKLDPDSAATPLYKYDNYTQYNNLKFQLPPYKVYRSNKTNEENFFISTTRKCHDCSADARNGLRFRPNGSEYDISFDEPPPDTPSSETCCWEWCDVPEDSCGDFKLDEVKFFEPNKNFIPVCYGDRVRILFINTLDGEGHPIHFHGHEFVIRTLYDVNNNTLTETEKFDINGPKLDTIYVPANKAVAFDFDAYNPGEHLIHCHIDDHLTGGMLITVRYKHDDECKDLPTFVGGQNSFPRQFCEVTGNCTYPKEPENSASSRSSNNLVWEDL